MPRAPRAMRSTILPGLQLIVPVNVMKKRWLRIALAPLALGALGGHDRGRIA